MKKLLFFVAFISTSLSAIAQSHIQPCHGQDTSHLYRAKTNAPVAIAVSNVLKVAVAGHNWNTYGGRATVKVWNNLTRLTQGLKPNDSVKLTQPSGLVYDNSGNLYIVQSERTDSNILIYDAGLHLLRVINNSPGTPLSWFNLRGIALDSAQNLYVVSGDSVGAGGADIPNTGKLIKITNPLSSATKTVLLTRLNAPKAVVVKATDVYITEYANNKIDRYNLTSMVKIDSASLNKPMDIFSTGCKLYCTEHDSNSIRVFDAMHLAGGVERNFARLDTNRGPFGIFLNGDMDLLVCDSNRVLFYSDSESISDTDYIAPTYTGGGGGGGFSWIPYLVCSSHTYTLFDSVRGGVWHTNDSTRIQLHRDIYDSLVHVICDTAGTYLVTYTYSGIIDSFFVTFSPAEVDHYVTLSDSLRGGTWYTRAYDSSLIALTVTAFDSIVRFYGYSLISTEVYYRHGSSIDTFHVFVDTIVVAGPIYTEGDAGSIYGFYRFCIGNIVQLYDDHSTYNSYWSISDTTVAFIDEADGLLWPYKPGTAVVTHTVISNCGVTTAMFNIMIDSEASAGDITGSHLLCLGSSIVLKDTVLGGIWSSTNTGIGPIVAHAGDSITVHGVSLGTTTIKYGIANTCADSLYHDIEVKPLPDAGTISGSGIVCLGYSTTFIDHGGTHGYWVSGNSSVATASGTDTTGYAVGVSLGSTLISYIDTNVCGADTVSTTISVYTAPTAATISGSSSVCHGSTTTLSASSGSGTWSSSSPSIASVSSSGVVTGVAVGAATITYTIASYCGSVFSTKSITVLPLPDAGTITGMDTVCTGIPVVYTSSGDAGGTWSTSSSVASINAASGVLTGVTTGAITVTYTVASSSCGTSGATFPVFIRPAPNAGTVTGASTMCEYDTYTFTSTVSGGTWSISNSSIATVVSSGDVTAMTGSPFGIIDTIIYTVSNSCGTARSTAVVNIRSRPTVTTITGLTTVCVGATIVDSAFAVVGAGGSSYWRVTNGNATITSSTAVSVFLLGVHPGTVILYDSAINACGATVRTTTVTINANADAGHIIGSSTLCAGSTDAFITHGSTLAYSSNVWYGSGGLAYSSAHDSVAYFTGTTPGTGIVCFSVINSCGRDTTCDTVSVIAPPHVGVIMGASAVCISASITLTDSVTGGTWSASNGRGSIASSGVVTGISAGIDTFTYSLTNYCGTATARHIVTINRLPNAGSISGPPNICLGTPVAFSSSSATGSWSVSNPHATMSSGGILSGISSGIDTVYFIDSTSCGSDTARFSVSLYPVLHASAIIGPSSVCIGSSVTLTDSTTGGTWSATNTHATVSGGGIVNGVTAGLDTIVYSISNYCGTAMATHIVTVNSLTTVADSIWVTRDSVCAGDTVTFTVIPTNGGSSPSFQWMRFSTMVDTGTTFTYIPTLGDVITCRMTSSVACPVPAVATSNSITMMVVPVVTPTVSIIATPNDTVAYIGQLITFYATATYGGTPTLYQWYEHGAAVSGATSSLYATHVSSNDTVYCIVTSNAPCATSTTASSNTIVIYADYLGIHDIQSLAGTFALFPNPNSGVLTISGKVASNDALAFEVRDVTAKLITTGTLQPTNGTIEQSIHLHSALPSGNYFIRIMATEGTVVLPFVKE